MQRMKLYTSGIKPQKLGSLHDRTIRNYMIKEAELEASKAQFSMLLAMTNPSFSNQQHRDEWVKGISKTWKDFLSKLFYTELPEVTPEEEALKQYYDQVVKKLKPTIRKDKKSGKLEVSGLEQMRF